MQALPQEPDRDRPRMPTSLDQVKEARRRRGTVPQQWPSALSGTRSISGSVSGGRSTLPIGVIVAQPRHVGASPSAAGMSSEALHSPPRSRRYSRTRRHGKPSVLWLASQKFCVILALVGYLQIPRLLAWTVPAGHRASGVSRKALRRVCQAGTKTSSFRPGVRGAHAGGAGLLRSTNNRRRLVGFR